MNPRGGPSTPRYRRDGNGIVWYMFPCAWCHMRGTLYFRVGRGDWLCHSYKTGFRDVDVTGEFQARRAALEDAKGAVRQALEKIGSDDRVEAAKLLQFAEGCCRRARFLVEKFTAPPGQPSDPEARR